MRIAIYQPRYFPQLHYFNRAINSDVFVILDCAQYTKALVHNVNGKKERHKSYQSDTVLKLPDGEHFLTIPVKHDGLLPINETLLDYSSDWARRHIATIASAYGKSPNFSKVFPQIEKLLKKNYQTLGELNVNSFLWALSCLMGLSIDEENLSVETINSHLKNSPFRLKKIVLGSDLGVPRPEGVQKGTEWTVAICKKLGATEYVHGQTAQNGYMDRDYYQKNNIGLVTQEWKCKDYEQQFNDRVPFIPNLSIIDLLLNVSEKEAVKIIKI